METHIRGRSPLPYVCRLMRPCVKQARKRARARTGPALAIGLLLAAMVPGMAGAASLHDRWDALLRTYVDAGGRVAYRGLERNGLVELDAYLDVLAGADPSVLPRAGQIAFWINAYNAWAVRGVIQGYNAEGILARHRFFSWFRFQVAGKERSLEEIEHEILRKRYREPRVHFALVCASSSCPRLRREAYRGERLDQQLDAQARGFLASRDHYRSGVGDTVYVSPILKWFEPDFVLAAGSLRNFLRRYVEVPATPRFEYLDYDWTMNAQEGQRPG